MRTVSKSATYLATEGVNSAPFKRGVRERGANFWQGKVQNSSPILGAHFGKEKCKTHRATKVTSLPSLSLSLSLSLCLSHRAHRAHNLGSASALPIISEMEAARSFSATDIDYASNAAAFRSPKNDREMTGEVEVDS